MKRSDFSSVEEFRAAVADAKANGPVNRKVAANHTRTSVFVPREKYRKPMFCVCCARYHVLRAAMVQCSEEHQGKFRPREERAEAAANVPDAVWVEQSDLELLGLSTPMDGETVDIIAATLDEQPAEDTTPVACHCGVNHRPGSAIAQKHAMQALAL